MKKFKMYTFLTFCLVLIVCLIPTGIVFADDDDGTNEVAAYGVNIYNFHNDLTNSVSNAEGFVDIINNYYTQSFFKTDDDVVQWDFESNSGADTADIAFFSGHGDSGTIILQNDLPYFWYDRADYWDCEWGDVDLEWMMLSACKTLECDSGYIKSEGKFAQSLNGIRLICGAHTTLSDTADGAYIANRLVDSDGGGPDIAQKVKDSWFYGTDQNQPSGRVLRVIGESYYYGEDYIWGQGSGPYYYTFSVDDYYWQWTYNCS